jgi:hypothetical protein
MLLQLYDNRLRRFVSAVENRRIDSRFEKPHIPVSELLWISTLCGAQAETIAKSHDNKVAGMPGDGSL